MHEYMMHIIMPAGNVSMSGTFYSTVDCLGIESSIASCNSTLLSPTSLPSIVDPTFIQCNGKRQFFYRVSYNIIAVAIASYMHNL